MRIIALVIFIVLFVINTPFVNAQDLKANSQTPYPPNEYFKAKVLQILDEGEKKEGNFSQKYQLLELKVLEGKESGEKIKVEYGIDRNLNNNQKVKNGETVIITKSYGPQGAVYIVSDIYRLPNIGIISIVFLSLVIIFARLKGIASITGLGISIAVLFLYVIPSIVRGENPFFVCVTGSFFIAIISLVVSHGFSKRTAVALGATLITLSLATGLSVLFVWLMKLSGGASEEVLFLQAGPFQKLNFQGILLGGIIIGTLGVLDDITTAQAAVVEQISKTDPTLSPKQLYYKGFSVGKEHIASLVNTLALAYIGASFPLMLMFFADTNLPFWVVANSEVITEEIVRTLVGSISLVLAVPITTILASHFLKQKAVKNKKGE